MCGRCVRIRTPVTGCHPTSPILYTRARHARTHAHTRHDGRTVEPAAAQRATPVCVRVATCALGTPHLLKPPAPAHGLPCRPSHGQPQSMLRIAVVCRITGSGGGRAGRSESGPPGRLCDLPEGGLGAFATAGYMRATGSPSAKGNISWTCSRLSRDRRVASGGKDSQPLRRSCLPSTGPGLGCSSWSRGSDLHTYWCHFISSHCAWGKRVT